MNPSRGARRLFQLIHRFIHKYGQFFASQEWIAAKLKASIRSVKRWTAELLSGGFIARKRRAQQTATYEIIKDLQTILAPHLAPQMAPQVAPHIKEEWGLTPSEKKPANSAVSLDSIFPPEYKTNEFGRRVLNPDFAIARDEWIRADRAGRIRRARDPARYSAAIVRSAVAGRGS